MSQLRKNILTGEWVVFASNRMEKPYYFKSSKKVNENDNMVCPFCLGHEKETTEPVYEHLVDGVWSVRVFNNKYPAVEYDNYDVNEDSFYTNAEGQGVHEVVVDTNIHNEALENYSENHMLDVLNTLKKRFIEINNKEEIEYTQIFKNNGPLAGASIAHSHWQIIGLNVIPYEQQISRNSMNAYKLKNNSCLICDMVNHELKENKRIIAQTTNFVALSPYASKHAFETWIVPKNHVSSIVSFNDENLKELGELLKEMVGKIKNLRDNVSYNLCFQDKVNNYNHNENHWYLKIIPRLGSLAGFENGTNSYINHVLPEDATKKLKTF